ncbi:AbiU2 domain-containing protein [Labrys wisconsinensis]|uniref:HEPN AbiU2-like domain-containing protein n=1 Tax=Labrys wisconsinensis TaxID=425677 RepID=A0ABU0J0D4_9HYPH|nr:hypothetical protein [Labrys wisconsinensis]MDQ0467011.1 hypothetical protein [Labrys wisconsinensis]
MNKKKSSKKRSIISKSYAVSRIDKMLPLIVENVRISIQLESMLETGNEVIGEIRGGEANGPHWYGAHCYNTVINSVILNFALSLAKLFDPGTKRIHPNKRDVASIPLLLRLMKQKRCQAALVARSRQWTSEMGSIVQHHEAIAQREIDEALAAYAKLTRAHSGRAAAATLKTFRDKKLAHSLIDPALKSLPRFEQLFFLLNTAMEIIAHVRLAVTGQNWQPEGFRKEARRQGKAFWSPAIKAVIEAERQFVRVRLE